MLEESSGESTRMLVENSPASLAPVDKSRGVCRVKRLQKRFSVVLTPLDYADLARGRSEASLAPGKGTSLLGDADPKVR